MEDRNSPYGQQASIIKRKEALVFSTGLYEVKHGEKKHEKREAGQRKGGQRDTK